ncbi:thymidylate kinase [Streptomyces sp. NPDC060232]|uniref:thymidylate kinase n=1 Tax=Streptomyces sp. NPDC060232 TaxID=3347079 RepID=UPI003665EF38
MTGLRGKYAPLTTATPVLHPFIGLEGVSGVGKSTLARLLALRMNGWHIHTPPDPHSPLLPTIIAGVRPLPQLAFLLSGLMHASDEIRRQLSDRPVIADRYLSSVVACHSAITGTPMDQVAAIVDAFHPYLVVPDATFYLTVSDRSLRERMGTKDDTKQDDEELFGVPGRLALLRQNFAAAATADPTAVLLEADGRTPDDLADMITAHLKERCA